MGELLGGLQTVAGHRHFDDDVVVNFGHFATFRQHPRGVQGNHFRRDPAINNFRDFANDLFKIAPALGDQ